MEGMGNPLQDLIKPSKVDVKPGADPARQAVIVVEPLERGFGLTLGNALRRVLLSSLPGAAVTSIRVDGVLHEFSSIPGVREDVVDFILNVKGITLKLHGTRARPLALKAKGPGPVTAGMIETSADVEIVNPDLILCHLDKQANLNMELTVSPGRGYVAASQNRPESAAVGVIPVDSIYSPIRSVSYRVQNTRVGQVTDYDSLSLTIETDGTVLPKEAVEQAASILAAQLGLFIQGGVAPVVQPAVPVTAEVDQDGFNPHLLRRVEDLELSQRSANCLKNDNILYVGDLARQTEQQMLRNTPNFGKKSLEEIREALKAMGLNFGMDIEGWPPENIEEMAKAHEESLHGSR